MLRSSELLCCFQSSTSDLKKSVKLTPLRDGHFLHDSSCQTKITFYIFRKGSLSWYCQRAHTFYKCNIGKRQMIRNITLHFGDMIKLSEISQNNAIIYSKSMAIAQGNKINERLSMWNVTIS